MEHKSQGHLYFETIQKLNKINLTVNSNKKYTVQNTGEVVPKKNISQNSCWILRKHEAAFEVPRLDIISRCSEPQETAKSQSLSIEFNISCFTLYFN